MSVQKILVDGVESVSMADGIVRMTFFCYTQSSYSGKPGHENVCELITSPAGLGRLKDVLEKLSANLPFSNSSVAGKKDEESNGQNGANSWGSP